MAPLADELKTYLHGVRFMPEEDFEGCCFLKK